MLIFFVSIFYSCERN